MKAKRELMKVKLPADSNFIPGLRSFIARVAYNFGFDDFESHQIEVVADEICLNAIEHGTKEKNGAVSNIDVECLFSKGQIELIITDSGNKAFNIEEVFALNRKRIEQGWSPEELTRRGRGLLLVQALVDGLKIEALPNKGTQVKIIKRHKSEGERKKTFAFPE